MCTIHSYHSFLDYEVGDVSFFNAVVNLPGQDIHERLTGDLARYSSLQPNMAHHPQRLLARRAMGCFLIVLDLPPTNAQRDWWCVVGRNRRRRSTAGVGRVHVQDITVRSTTVNFLIVSSPCYMSESITVLRFTTLIERTQEYDTSKFRTDMLERSYLLNCDLFADLCARLWPSKCTLLYSVQ